jgi:hypothetical protein
MKKKSGNKKETELTWVTEMEKKQCRSTQWRTQKLSEAWANMSKTLFFQTKSLCKVRKYKASYVGKPGRLPGL